MTGENALYLCPICKRALAYQKSEKGPDLFSCKKGHSFDISKAGYVNLLPANHRHSKLPGDNVEMIRARRDFLALEYYAPLKELLAQQILSRFPHEAVIVDAGCGEGYYTSGISGILTEAGCKAAVYGFDLSKSGVQIAAKRDPSLFCAVASVFDLPLPERSADVVLSLFAPVAEREFARLLKKGGWLFVASPSPKHLFGLKQVLYDEPYENAVKVREYEGFVLEDTLRLDYEAVVSPAKAIEDLFHMTPYAYNSHREASGRLEGLQQLSTPLGFVIACYRRES